MGETYILDDNDRPVPADVVAAYQWRETHRDRWQIGDDSIGESRVSTVFLVSDHGWGSPVPVLWETLVFGGPLSGEGERYTSADDARRGHAAMVARVREYPGGEE